MADLSITAASVLPGDNAEIDHDGRAGETITAGKVVYKDASTKKYLLADNNSVTVAARQGIGIALNGAALDQPLEVQRSGDITIGAALTAGAPYYLSETAGGIQPAADLVTTGEYICLLGLAESTTVLHLDIQFPGVAV